MTNPQPPSTRVTNATKAHLAQFSDADMAHHEAGHAVIYHLNGGTIKRLSIDRADARRGAEMAPQRPTVVPAAADASGGDDTKTRLENTVAVLVAGDAAGTLFGTPEPLVTAGSRVDHEQALRAAAEAGVIPEDARAMIDAAWERARERLRQPENWRLVESLAQALLKDRTLDAARIDALLKG
jgi:hypothetical protein